MRFAGALLLSVFSSFTAAYAHHEPGPGLRASVLKVVATGPSGAQAFGSAVVIGPGELLTNCHVLRSARFIEVVQESRRWRATRHAGNNDRDLCVLSAPGVDAPPATLGSAAKLKAGQRVYALGYPAGGALIATSGRVESLYQFEDGKVIQTSARFDPGASGGALFTAAGELVGILTFKAPHGGIFHFAVPVDWIASLDRASTHSHDPELAFWERDPRERPLFLRAAWYASKREWPALFEICARWAQSEGGRSEADLAMVSAIDRLLDLSGGGEAVASLRTAISEVSGSAEESASHTAIQPR